MHYDQDAALAGDTYSVNSEYGAVFVDSDKFHRLGTRRVFCENLNRHAFRSGAEQIHSDELSVGFIDDFPSLEIGSCDVENPVPERNRNPRLVQLTSKNLK